MIRSLALALLLMSLKTSLIKDPEDMCNLLKNDLHKVTRVFHEMSQEDRNRLFTFSMRGMTHTFLRRVSFLNKDLEEKRTKLLADIDPLWKAYEDWKDPGAKMEEKMVDETVDQLEEKDKLYQGLGAQAGQVNNRMQQNLRAMNDLIQEMKGQVPDIVEKSDLSREINGTLGMQMAVEETNNSLLTVIDDMRRHFPNDSQIQEKLATLEQKIEDYLYLKRLVEVETESKKDFKFKPVPALDTEVAAIQQNITTLEADLAALKKQLKADLEAKASTLHSEITGAAKYPQFQGLLTETKDLLSRFIKAQIYQVEVNEELLKSSYTTQSFNLQKLRIHPKEIMDFQIDLVNIDKLKSNVPEHFDEKDYADDAVGAEVKGYFQQNSARLDELNQFYGTISNKLDILQKLLDKEKELDKLFAYAFADLQGGSTPTPGFRCFSILEMSVYVYYMNIAQVIVSKHGFYETFLKSLEVGYSTQLMKHISKDFEGRPLEDPEIFDPVLFNLQPEGMEKWISRFSFMINEDLDKVFEEQISGNNDWMSNLTKKIMSASGFTFNVLIETIKEGTMNLLFDQLLTTILTAFSVVEIGDVEFTFLGTLLTCVTEVFVGWLGKQIRANPYIMKEFNEQKIKLWNKFTKNEMEYLDIEDFFDDAEQARNYEQKKQDKAAVEDTTEAYKQLFLQMVEVESSYRVSESIDDQFHII